MKLRRTLIWIITGSFSLSIGWLSALGAITLFSPPQAAANSTDKHLVLPETGIVTILTPLGPQSFAYGVSEDSLQVAVNNQVLSTEIRNGVLVDLIFRTAK